MIATLKILCSECQRENEAERVYCHHCGARLDRSAVVPTKEPVDDTRKRVRKLFDPQRAKLRFMFFKISKLILSAGALAIFIQLVSPPDLPAPTKTLILASQIRLDMETATQRHQPVQLEFTEDQVNAYLASALRSKQATLNKPLLEFKRAVAGFSEEIGTITVERSLSGYYSLYTSAGYSVSIVEGKMVARTKAGHIGRMPIHPQLMQLANVLFADVLGALDRDAKLVSKFNAIQFHDKHVQLALTAP